MEKLSSNPKFPLVLWTDFCPRSRRQTMSLNCTDVTIVVANVMNDKNLSKNLCKKGVI